ncbi:hypothetical protein BS47DRAFT_1371242 [Hydnum rufescens UP504]|uniref:protein-histidine N-methyltransferase n=1 Tax=Hydnum rufescens UP504 TaxID=1448309 RepID=A0A9P6E132_9AGAM|nr:hypothetical protein BS47DRAFT_1371242 [Hydnum rufescens UP504]
MFKFDFEVEDPAPSKIQTSPGASEVETGVLSSNVLDEYAELSLIELLDALPPAISYSRLIIPSEGEVPIVLPRRDLYDARFQLLSLPTGLNFVDAPSDLVPGVYEGGLKTWECSIDLAAYLASLTSRPSCHPQWIRGKHVLEVGCGTAIPTLYLLHQLFNYSNVENIYPHPETETVIHLQDYNRTAIELVRIRKISNMIVESRSDDCHPETDVEISPELIDAFCASLRSLHITLRFFTGSWKSLLETKTSVLHTMVRPYDIVLTSETIYRQASLESLIGGPSWCLVAAKVVYFGVGGGVNEFLRAING